MAVLTTVYSCPVDESPTIAQSLATVRDADSSFGFIEWFAREWGTAVRDGDGNTAAEVAAAGERLGLGLPRSVAAFYRLIGRRADLTSNQDHLLPVSSLRVKDEVLVYRVENQGCADWGVRVSDLRLPDPPVVVRWMDGPWRPFLDSFSLAAVELVLYESFFAGPDGCDDNRALDDDADRARLEERYERLPLPAYPGWWQPDEPDGVRWFGGPDVLMMEHSRSWLWVRARNPGTIARVREELPGDWLMAPE